MRNLLLFVSIFVLSAMATQPSEKNHIFSRTVAFGADSGDHGGKIVSEYDGFNHETVVTLRKMKVACTGRKLDKNICMSIQASLSCPGVQLDYVSHVTLQVVFETKNWDERHPLDQRDLSVVADAETFRLGRMEFVSESLDTLMTETLQIQLPYRTFKKIAHAEIVELQVGKSRFALRDKNLAALRDLNNRVKFSKGI
jgi:hypothetical protein